MPSTHSAEFLVPLSAGRQTGAGTLMAYRKLRRRPQVRLTRAAIAGAMRIGLVPMTPAQRLRVLVNDDVSDTDLPEVSPTHWLARGLGSRELVAALGVPTMSPNSKPTLQLFTPAGQPAGYAKFAWNESTRMQVANEAQAIVRVAGQLTSIDVPRCLWRSSWRGFDVSVTEPMPQNVRAWRAPEPPPLATTEEVAKISGVHSGPLAQSGIVLRIADFVHRPSVESEESLRVGMSHALEVVTSRWGPVVLRQGTWHGDWVPWNIATSSDRTIAWDWEHSRDDVPVGLDILHWHFQRWFIRHGLSVGEALLRMRADSAEALRTLQSSTSAAEACAALYVLEICARYLTMHAAGAGWAPRFFPDILAVLSELKPS